MAAPTLEKTILDTLDKINNKVDAQGTTIAELKTKANTPVFPNGIDPSKFFFRQANGPLSRESQGYSIFKAIGLSKGWVSPDVCKEEIEMGRKLKEMYRNHSTVHPQSILIPYSTRDMPRDDGGALALEFRHKMMDSTRGYDPEETNWIRQKAMGTISDTAGGSLVPFPVLGDMIDLQRNLEVFTRAGASEITLPPNGQIDYPKLTGGSTAYWVGEGLAITASQQTTGVLRLNAKKLGVIVPVNNELFRFAGPSAEGMIRNDMARQAALKADLAMLEGTGGTQPKGLITYPTSSAWTQGEDKLLTYAVTSATLQPQDIEKASSVLPDEVVNANSLTWIMRNQLWGDISTRRGDAITANDQHGTFVFNWTRTAGEKLPLRLNDAPVVTSSQVSKTRGTGAQTYALVGMFSDWIIGRFGVLEVFANTADTTSFYNDQTAIRCIQFIDCGPRHSSSFCLIDGITVAPAP